MWVTGVQTCALPILFHILKCSNFKVGDAILVETLIVDIQIKAHLCSDGSVLIYLTNYEIN